MLTAAGNLWRTILFSAVLLGAVTLACGGIEAQPAAATTHPRGTMTATRPPTRTPTSTVAGRAADRATPRPTRTRRPTATTRSTATPTPVDIACYVTARALNLRAGPGVGHDVIGRMTEATVFAAVARDEEATWVRGDAEGGETGWTSARYLDCDDDLSLLPVAPSAQSSAGSATATPVRTTSRSSTPAARPTTRLTAEPTARPAATTAPPPSPSGGLVLLQPLAPELNGWQTFKWQAPAPAPGLGYELIFWAPGEDPMANGIGVVGVTEVPEVQVNIDSVVNFFPQLHRGNTYRWGVLEVELMPYARVAYLGGGHAFTIPEAVGGNGEDDDDDGDLLPPPK